MSDLDDIDIFEINAAFATIAEKYNRGSDAESASLNEAPRLGVVSDFDDIDISKLNAAFAAVAEERIRGSDSGSSNLDSASTSPRRLWVFAAVMALALHLGGAALAISYAPAADDDEGLGEADADYAVELASPKAPDSNAPPGPESQASQAAPSQPEQTAEPKETDLPQDRPQEADDPDRLVTENSSKKPEDDSPKPAAPETQASVGAPQSADSAPRTLDENAPQSDKPKAPNPGLDKDRLRLTADWDRKVGAYLRRHLRYPKDRKDSAVVTVKISFVINRRGNVVSVEVTESSGDRAYDEAAISMVKDSDPLPAPPVTLTEDTYLFKLPVVFRPQDRKG